MILQVYIDQETQRRLAAISRETGRTVEDLAEAAVSDAALQYCRHTRIDPGRADGGNRIVMRHKGIAT